MAEEARVPGVIMASGLADFYRGVDVAYQALGQMIVRPKYGGAEQVNGSVIVDASVATRLVSIQGKGVLYSGTVWLDDTSTQANSSIGMKLDGWFLASLSFVRMNDYGLVNPRSSIFSLNKYDAKNHIYSIGLSYGITFESYLDLYYGETYGRTPNVFYYLAYALI